MTSSANPSIFGQTVTFTATVTATAPASGTPTGTVTFKDGAATLGTGTLSGGVATFAISSLAIGNHTITAVYGGDTNDVGSQGSTAQTVKAAIRLKPGESADLDLVIAPATISGNFQELVTIRSNAKRRPAVTVIIQGVVQG